MLIPFDPLVSLTSLCWRQVRWNRMKASDDTNRDAPGLPDSHQSNTDTISMGKQRSSTTIAPF
jgi:hypothetical protein